jgi:phosphatidylinositol alpha 1,6-mannosyltransferase
MRIAIVTESFLPRTDGVVRTVVALLDFLYAHSHQAIVFAAGPGPDRYRGFQVTRVRGLRFPYYPALTIAPLSISMSAEMRAFGPDIVHLASPFVLGVQGRRIGQRLGVPVVAHYQTDVASYSRYYGLGFGAAFAQRHLLRLHNRCRATYVPTVGVARRLGALGFENVRVSGRGVDATLFHPRKRSDQLRRSLLQDGERLLLLYVGRLSSEKNLLRLKPLVSGCPGVRLVLVGEGPIRQELERAFAGLPVTFTGVRHGEDLAAHYASADIFVFPSETETFGQVVQEAMASALPIVAARAGGVQDLFVDRQEGLLVSPGPHEHWIDAIRELSADPDLRRRLGTRARSAAEARTWDAVHSRLLKDYHVIVSGTTCRLSVA